MTILREEEHRALHKLSVSGKVADLGGDTRSDYHSLIGGTRDVTCVNMDPKAAPDVVADLEEPLSLESSTYNGVLLMNVLEHVYHGQQLLTESKRILVPGGMIVIAVPYLMPFHPSPNDYFRFSRQALERMLSDAGFTNVSITALGSGVFAARFLLLERLFPGNIQRIIGPVLHPLVRVLDAVVASIARDMNKKYSIEDYALGFVVTAYA